MPYVNIQILQGATREEKREVVQQVTQTLVSVLGKKLEKIHVVIHEVPAENWGFMGQLTDEL
jgi:4-oxalocrotonate tautomerase